MDREEFQALFDSLDHIGQNADELWEVVQRLQAANISKMIEVGVSRGGSMRVWDAVVGKGGTIVGIDNEDRLQVSGESIFWDFNTANAQIHYVVGDSRVPSTIDRVREVFSPGEVDFLWVDADHNYEPCRDDHNNYLEFVRPGGIIGIHDAGIEGVNRFIQELGDCEIIDFGLGTALRVKP